MTGTVRARPAGMANPQLRRATSRWPRRPSRSSSEADTPPFPIEDRIEAGEELRLRYRYLDLRRPRDDARSSGSVTGSTRSRATTWTRLGFLEVETPLLTRSTPEGARDFLVPSRLWPGIVLRAPAVPAAAEAAADGRRARTGTTRSSGASGTRRRAPTGASSSRSSTSRCPSSTRMTSFAVIEPLYARYVREIHGVEVATPFPRMTYDEMLDRLRQRQAGPPLRDGARRPRPIVFAGTGFNAFASVLASDGGAIKGLAAPGGGQLSRKELDQLVAGRERSWRGGPRVDRRRGRWRPLARREAPVDG